MSSRSRPSGNNKTKTKTDEQYPVRKDLLEYLQLLARVLPSHVRIGQLGQLVLEAVAARLGDRLHLFLDRNVFRAHSIEVWKLE
jgi:hypothetical protein